MDDWTGALGLSVSDAVIIAAVLGYFVKMMADYRGWTRSPALVRAENTDLRTRNATLESELKQLTESDRAKGERIAALEAQVAELQKRDQAAVLEAIARQDDTITRFFEKSIELQRVHETSAASRTERTIGVLTGIYERLGGGAVST